MGPNTNTTETRTSDNLDFIVTDMGETVLFSPEQEQVVADGDETVWIVIIVIISLLGIGGIIAVVVYYQRKLGEEGKGTKAKDEDKGVKPKTQSQTSATNQAKNTT